LENPDPSIETLFISLDIETLEEGALFFKDQLVNGTGPMTIPRLYFPKLDAELNVTIRVERLPEEFSLTFHEEFNGFCIKLLDFGSRVNFKNVGFYFIPNVKYEIDEL